MVACLFTHTLGILPALVENFTENPLPRGGVEVPCLQAIAVMQRKYWPVAPKVKTVSES